MTELRAADLRFTSSEAAEFLNQVMGLDLSTVNVLALETRTEGWIAGLQMAAISIQGRADIASFIQAFTGSHRFVLDYLVEEVLQRQPESVRSFLLQTSILDRLSSELCDAVLRREDSRAMLETLERDNLFLVSLDDNRQWYRYLHFFADVLQARLLEEQFDQVATLHRRASEWYEQNGLMSEAIHQALAAKDVERVADLAELAWQDMDDSFQSSTWLGWVKILPEELIRNRPVLSVQYAWALWLSGELEASEARLRDAERWLEPPGDLSGRREGSPEGMVVVDEEQFRTLPATIALARTLNAQSQGDVSGAVKYAEQVLKLIPEDDFLERSRATVSLGFTYWASGDLEGAYRALVEWIESAQKSGNIVFAVASTFAMADIMVAQGRLHEAVRAYKKSLRLASEHDEHVQRVIAHLYLGLAMLYHEVGDQEAAAQYLQKGSEMGELSTLPDWPTRWSLAQAQLKESRGDLDAALDLLEEAKRLYVRNTMPVLYPVEALKARVYIRQDRLPEAVAWSNERGLSVEDELSYLSEFEHITLARLLLAEYERTREEQSVLQALGLLERLLEAAEDRGGMGSVIKILVLQALAHQARGEITLANAPLERALALAEPEGYLRIFVDEGPPMAALLKQVKAESGNEREYIQKLLAAFDDKESQSSSISPQPLIEPLSERELDVLQLIAQGLTNPEIASKLYLSLNTVKAHTRNIYGKLEVNNRTQAVAKARSLGVLPLT
jgi:LuxR family maltose regulon positive regulatory protein